LPSTAQSTAHFWLLEALLLFDLASPYFVATFGFDRFNFLFSYSPFAVPKPAVPSSQDPLMTSSFVIGLYFYNRWMDELAPDLQTFRSHDRKRMENKPGMGRSCSPLPSVLP